MHTLHHDTKAWKLQVWASFATAVTLCFTGLAWLPGADLDRAFMVMGYLFTLAKTLRDAHEAALAEARAQGRASANAFAPSSPAP